MNENSVDDAEGEARRAAAGDAAQLVDAEPASRKSRRHRANHQIDSTGPTRETALIIHPARDAAIHRSPEAMLEEARGLAEAIDLVVVDALVAPISRPRPATLFGLGKLTEIRDRLDAETTRPGLVIVDGPLTPVQHRNLEKEWNAKVLDRTALILEIFGARASTAEGRLQVDLAHLNYQRSRLVRSWTHLERQRGGAGFLGGPGERQIESDRRALKDKIDRLESKLDQVRRTRALQRAARKKAPHAVVAFVGYTNAGKSTLFNRLTASDVYAKDLLFATLDPTMRAVDTPSGERIVVSDTVGFVSDLPTQLVAAFRATLEEVREADILVHVRDAAHPDADAQRADVIAVLEDLDLADPDEGGPLVIEALNKIDLLDADDRAATRAIARASVDDAPMTLEEPLRAALSAATGEGVEQFLDLIDAVVTRDRRLYEATVAPAEGAARAWLYAQGDVRETNADDGDERILVRLSDKAYGQFSKEFPSVRVVAAPADVAARRIA